MAVIEKLVRQELPPEDDKHYKKFVVEQCILAFEVLQSDKLALDWVGVTGKHRAMVLENSEYKRRTRQSTADKHMDMIFELNQISDNLKVEAPDESKYDIRGNPKDAANFEKDTKENTNQRLKVMDIKRDVLRMGHGKDEASEADSINIFFIGVTAKEFADMDTVEIHEGDDTGLEVFDDEGSDDPLQIKIEAKEKEIDDSNFEFIRNQDGSLSDVWVQIEKKG